MATIMIEEERFAPPGYRFCAYDSDTYDGAPDAPNRSVIGLGDTHGEAVADLLTKVSDTDLEEMRWAAATWGESAAWIRLMEAEQAERAE